MDTSKRLAQSAALDGQFDLFPYDERFIGRIRDTVELHAAGFIADYELYHELRTICNKAAPPKKGELDLNTGLRI
jgi:hypothetical protein